MNPKDLTAARGEVYGHPLDNFRRMALIESAIRDCSDPEVRQALYMIGAKLTRLVETPDHEDSINDIMGYAETIHMIHAERERREALLQRSQSNA